MIFHDAAPLRRFFHFNSILRNNQTVGDERTGVGMIFQTGFILRYAPEARSALVVE
jgi:hypothetical protein